MRFFPFNLFARDQLKPVKSRFRAARRADPALRGANLGDTIRHVESKRAILRGTLEGRPVIFRLHLDENSKAPAKEWAEMERVWPLMQTGALRVAEPLHFSAAHGLIVMEDVAGTPLLEHLYSLDPAARGGLMNAPADWLKRYVGTTETWEPPRADFWRHKAKEMAAQQPHPRLQRREAKVLKQLRRLQPAAMAQDWRFAICHGDFHPNNLILNGDRLTGIDLGGSGAMPVYKDIARFLMHMGRRGMLPSGQSYFGVDAEAFDAFSAAFDLSAWEREIVLPFMLGCEALLRVEGKDMRRSRLMRAADMYDLLIEDLKLIPTP